MKWLELAIQLATVAQLLLKVIKGLFGFPPDDDPRLPKC